MSKKFTTVCTLNMELSLTELSSKVNGKNGKPQAFKLLKVVAPSNNEIGG